MCRKSLQLQPRLDPHFENQYNRQIGSYLYFNMPIIEILDYTALFQEMCEKRKSRHRHIPTSNST